MADLMLVLIVLAVTSWVMAIAVRDLWQQTATRPTEPGLDGTAAELDNYQGSMAWTSLDDSQLQRWLAGSAS